MINVPLAIAIRVENIGSRLRCPQWIWRSSTQALRRLGRVRRDRARIQHIIRRRDQSAAARALITSVAWLEAQRRPLIALDVGARGGPLPEFRAFHDVVTVTLVEPHHAEAKRLRRAWGTSCSVVEVALGATISEGTLRITRNPGGSSLLVPDEEGIATHVRSGSGSDLKRFHVDEEAVVKVTTLEELTARSGMDFEIVKIDTQGSEGPIVAGFGTVRPLLLQLELTDDVPLYRGEWRASEVVCRLKDLGYVPIGRPRGHHGDWKFLRNPVELRGSDSVHRALVASCVLGVLDQAAARLSAVYGDLPLVRVVAEQGADANHADERIVEIRRTVSGA